MIFLQKVRNSLLLWGSAVTVFLVTFFVAISVAWSATWVGPTQDPPLDNPDGFIYNGTTEQENANLHIDGMGIFGEICFGSDTDDNCRASWDDVISGSIGYWEELNGNIYYNSGRVGIGVSSPGAMFHVRNTADGAVNTVARFETLRTGSRVYLELHNTDPGNTNRWAMFNAADGRLGFAILGAGGTPANDALVINPNANIGIGTSNINSASSLHIVRNNPYPNAEVALQSNSGTNNHWAIYNDRSNNSFHVWGIDNRFSILRNGNVGISATNPQAKLQVEGEIAVNRGGGISNVRMQNGNSSAVLHRNDGTNYWMLLTNASDQWGSWNSLRPFRINNATGDTYIGNNALYVQHGGNVGIGNTSPAHNLHISSSGTTNAELDIQSGNRNYWGIYHDYGTEDLRFWNSDVPGGGNAITIKNNGNIGIGSGNNKFPRHKVEISGNSTQVIQGVFNENVSGVAGTHFGVSYDGSGNYNAGTWMYHIYGYPNNGFVFANSDDPNGYFSFRARPSGTIVGPGYQEPDGSWTQEIARLNLSGMSVTGNINATGQICAGTTCLTPGSGGGGSFWQPGSGSDIWYLGNVGIGTNSPTNKLDVNGSIHLHSDAITGGPNMMLMSYYGSASNFGGGIRVNEFWDGSTMRRVRTGPSGTIQMNETGNWIFDTNASGNGNTSIAPSAKMVISNNGEIGMPAVSSGTKLRVSTNSNQGITTAISAYDSITSGGGMALTAYSYSGIASYGISLTGTAVRGWTSTGWSGHFYGGKGTYSSKSCIGDQTGCQDGAASGYLMQVINPSGSSRLGIKSNPGSQAAIDFMDTNSSAFTIYKPQNTRDLSFWADDLNGTGGRVMTILGSNGYVGIGTTIPTERLTVAGNISASGNVTTGGGDMAEEFATDTELEPGTVVIIGDNGFRSVKPSEQAYDKRVIGVVSDEAGLIMGKIEAETKAIVAMVGVVSVKVTGENGEVEAGDLLVASDRAGYAMRDTKGESGTIIGKALEDFNGNRGTVKALINLQ